MGRGGEKRRFRNGFERGKYLREGHPIRAVGENCRVKDYIKRRVSLLGEKGGKEGSAIAPLPLMGEEMNT